MLRNRLCLSGWRRSDKRLILFLFLPVSIFFVWALSTRVPGSIICAWCDVILNLGIVVILILSRSQISNQAIRAEALENGVETELNASIVASTLTFTCGIITLLMGILRFKFLADYFSDALISGFICGAAIHTVISQVQTLFKCHLNDCSWISLLGLNQRHTVDTSVPFS